MIGWSRKDFIQNIDSSKHVTLGSTVVAIRYVGHQLNVKCGDKGKVIETGTANRWSAKRALGTIAAMRIDWEIK